MRPGVPAAKELALENDAEAWLQVENDFTTSQSSLYPHEKNMSLLAKKLLDNYPDPNLFCLNKSELLETVLAWKFSVGKTRPAVRKLVEQNTDSAVRSVTHAALLAAMQLTNQNSSEKEVVNMVCELKGIGPAGASAILSLVRPDLFAYMYDETIEALCAKRVYTLTCYADMNLKCKRIATVLEASQDHRHDGKAKTSLAKSKSAPPESKEAWTPHRAATILWMSARLAAAAPQSNQPKAESAQQRSNSKRSLETTSESNKKTREEET